MFRNELSRFLTRVLDEVDSREHGVAVDSSGRADVFDLAEVAEAVGAEAQDVDSALEGLLASSCLVEGTIEFPGIAPVVWWSVHPQVRKAG